MRNLKLLSLILVLALALSSCSWLGSIFVPDPSTKLEDTKLTITSEKSVSLELGQSYTLTYDTDGVVTVTVSGGTYNKDSQKFTADQVGTYTITVKALADGKNEVTDTVTVTVTSPSSDKAALSEVLNKVSSLVASDYTSASWKNLEKVAGEATNILNTAGVSQESVDEATASVERALAALVSTLVKAEIAEDQLSFVWNGSTYKADDYTNFSDIIAKIAALNENTEITLKSQYTLKINEILATLVAKLKLTIKTDLKNNAAMVVETLGTYVIVAESEDGVTYTWYVNGTEAGTSAELSFTPDDFKQYEIKCVVSDGTNSNTKTINVSFTKADYVVNPKFEDVIKVEDNVIEVSGALGWGDEEGKKVRLPYFKLTGDFTVYFDLVFTQTNGDVNVMALFLNNDQGESILNWVAVRNQDNKLEVAVGGSGEEKPLVDMPAGTVNVGNKMHFMATRKIVDGRSYLYAYLLDDYGNVLVEHTAEGMSKDYLGSMTIGIQSENAHITVSGLAVGINDKFVNTKALADYTATLPKLVKSDYTDESWNRYIAAQETAKAATTQSELTAAIAAIEEARLALAPATFEKADIGESKFTYGGRDYAAAEYSNYSDVVAQITELNATVVLRSEYTSKIEKAIAGLLLNVQFTVESTLFDGMNAIIRDFTPYTLTASSEIEGLTYEWFVNGTSRGTGAEFEFTPDAFGKFTIKCVATTTTGASAERVMTVSFVESDVKTPDELKDRVTINDDGSFTTATGLGWGHWEGRKVLYDDLVFNGSFSITMDLTFDARGDGANVATIHLLNADTLSPSFGGDWAYVGYGCICLHENPVRLETNWSGTGKKQSSDGGFESVAAEMAGVADLLEVGDTFTVKLTCYRNAARQLQLCYSLYNSKTGEWIEFSRDEWAGDMGGGFIVGINIENAGITAKNVRYELLDGTADYLAGSVKSKARLSSTLAKYADIKVGDYLDAREFLDAYRAGYATMSDNSTGADYDAAADRIIEAVEKLTKREVLATVPGLDDGYTVFVGKTQLELKFLDDYNDKDIVWSFKLNGEPQTVNTRILPLTNGIYTDVVLSFKTGPEAHTFKYHDFEVKGVSLKSNTDRVTIDGTTVKVDDGAGWGQKDQLVLEGIRTQEFELFFNVKYDGTPGGGYRVMCINLFGEDARPVFGYQREDRGDRAQLGFDSNGQWIDINNTDAADDAYDYIFSQAARFSLKQTLSSEGKFTITFTVYAADGSVIATMSSDYIRWYDTSTDIRFTFENIDLTISDIEVAYH